MRVLHVIESLDPKTGGPPAVAARLAAAQAAAGCTAALAAIAEQDASQRTAASFAGIPGFDRVAIHPLPGPRGPLGRLGLGPLTDALTDLARNADVLHVHGVWDVTVRAAHRAARRSGTPLVIVPHGMLDPWSLRSSPLKRLKKSLALALVFRRILNHASFFHTLNADERDGMAPLGLTPPCEVIPNGVFLDEFRDLPPAGAFHAQHPELQGQPYILFLSRLHHKKGLDILAEAFASLAPTLPAVRLVVAGPDGGAQAPLLAQAHRLGIAHRLHVVGPLYGPDKLAALCGCAVFCLPSRQEGFSMAITEAMACARPVVVSRACHFPEVTQAHAGIEIDLTPQSLATALARVLQDPSPTNAMGRAGRALVESRFTWPAIAALTQQAYTKHLTVTRP